MLDIKYSFFFHNKVVISRDIAVFLGKFMTLEQILQCVITKRRGDRNINDAWNMSKEVYFHKQKEFIFQLKNNIVA